LSGQAPRYAADCSGACTIGCSGSSLARLASSGATSTRFRPRAGVLGGSYGGFMTAWLAAHHERFRAGICERAVFAWDSLLGTSDIGHTMTSMVGTDPAQWPAQTPLAHVDKIRIPLLILHWEGDLRVPFEQAQRMFAALRARRAPVELMVFPGGDHGVSRAGPPDHRLMRFEVILEWFDRHLG